MTRRRVTKSFPIAGLKAANAETGEFEAIVAVFGNVDSHGDRIKATAFDETLARRQTSGDPLPIIFSHQWHDLNAYIGEAAAADIEALNPGHADLPDAIKELGGLRVRGQLYTDDPTGRKAARLLKSRAVKEFSFAYDIIDEERSREGFNELNELDLIEAGPTLKGANPLTQLVDAKADDLAAAAEVFGIEPDQLKAIAEAFAGPADTDPGDGPGNRAKAWVTLSGSIERIQEAVHRSATEWAREEYGDNLFTVELEATFADRSVFYVELWDEPAGAGRYFEASFDAAGDTVTLGAPELVEFEATTVTVAAGKAATRFGRKEGRRNSTSDAGRIQAMHDLTAELGATCEDPDGATDEEPDGADADNPGTTKAVAPGVLLTTIETELLDID